MGDEQVALMSSADTCFGTAAVRIEDSSEAAEIVFRPAWRRARLKHARDPGNVVERTGRNADRQVVGPIVAEGETDAEHAEERDRRGSRESLVAVDERMVASERLQQRSGLARARAVVGLGPS